MNWEDGLARVCFLLVVASAVLVIGIGGAPVMSGATWREILAPPGVFAIVAYSLLWAARGFRK